MILKKRASGQNLTIFQCSGELSEKELAGSVLELFDSSEVSRCILWDFRETAAAGLSSGSFYRLAEIVRERANLRLGGRTAILVSEMVEFGLARMFENLVNTDELPYEMAVFRDHDAAMAWLAQR